MRKKVFLLSALITCRNDGNDTLFSVCSCHATHIKNLRLKFRHMNTLTETEWCVYCASRRRMNKNNAHTNQNQLNMSFEHPWKRVNVHQNDRKFIHIKLYIVTVNSHIAPDKIVMHFFSSPSLCLYRSRTWPTIENEFHSCETKYSRHKWYPSKYRTTIKS